MDRRGRLAAVALLAATFAAAPAFAQDDRDVVVVTANMIMSEDDYAEEYGELPYVSVVAPADFVMFTVSLESASNNIVEREAELDRAYRGLVQKVARAQGVEMEVGTPGSSAPTETATSAEVIRKAARRSTIPVLLRFEVRPNETFAQVRTRAEAFIKEITVTGRAEATTGADQYIGLREPAKHRADLLRKIAEDTRLMQDIFANTAAAGSMPGISLTGLGGRVKTRPVGPMEIEMFIPYSIVLGAPLPQPPPR
jgi:hypothetical protein